MKIVEIDMIGARRPLCTCSIRVADPPVTYEAKRQIAKREALSVAIDRCIKRADLVVDHVPMCRSHAAAAALKWVMER